MQCFTLVFILVLLQISFLQAGKQSLKSSNLHDEWDAMLQQFVKGDVVDYKGFQSKANGKLNLYLEKLNKAFLSGFNDFSVKEQLAFYINLYNAYTVRLILDNPEVTSIRDIKRPWKRNFVSLGKKKKSLNDIEHKIIRKYFKEPRVHFALVCASIGCPSLKPFAFVADKLDKQLVAASRYFLADKTKNQFTASESRISDIFNWYGGDFDDLEAFFKNYAPESFNPEAPIDYLEYNWKLNSL